MNLNEDKTGILETERTRMNELGREEVEERERWENLWIEWETGEKEWKGNPSVKKDRVKQEIKQGEEEEKE